MTDNYLKIDKELKLSEEKLTEIVHVLHECDIFIKEAPYLIATTTLMCICYGKLKRSISLFCLANDFFDHITTVMEEHNKNDVIDREKLVDWERYCTFFHRNFNYLINFSNLIDIKIETMHDDVKGFKLIDCEAQEIVGYIYKENNINYYDKNKLKSIDSYHVALYNTKNHNKELLNDYGLAYSSKELGLSYTSDMKEYKEIEKAYHTTDLSNTKKAEILVPILVKVIDNIGRIC